MNLMDTHFFGYLFDIQVIAHNHMIAVLYMKLVAIHKARHVNFVVLCKGIWSKLTLIWEDISKQTFFT